MIVRADFKLRNALNLSSAGAAIAAGLMFAPSTALAQQVVPNSGPECPIVTIDGERVAQCEGDLEDGVSAYPGTPDFDRIVIRDADAPIAPPGYFGIGLVKDNGDLDAVIEDGIVIDVFDDPNINGAAQGIIAITQNGFDISLETGADITADGRGSSALGIEAIADGGGLVRLTNDGDITATTTGDSAIAMQARANLGGGVGINNSGVLRAQSEGSGERNAVTAGILGLGYDGANVSILNDGDIFVTTSPEQFDTDFNGVAAAIVGNALMDSGASGVTIVNDADLTVSGNQTHGIVAYAQLTGSSQFPGAFPFVDPDDFTVEYFDSIPDRAIVSVATSGTITTNGDATYGVLAQAAGTLSLINVASSSDIDMTAPGSFGTGIFAWSQSESSLIQVINAGAITGSGDGMRGIGLAATEAPGEGEYLMTLDNDGSIAFDAPRAFGITLYATTGDNVSAEVDNSGDIDLSSTTDPDSIGISVNFAGVDETETRDGNSELTLINSGDITMGAGTAIFATGNALSITNSGNLSATADDSAAVGIEANAVGGGSATIVNEGEIVATTTGDSAIALQGRSNAQGEVGVAIANSGTLEAHSQEMGEREFVTAGILGFSEDSRVTIANLGDITVSTSPDAFDTDFNGIAGAIVGNSFANTTDAAVDISNDATLVVSGGQTHGIVGYAEYSGTAAFDLDNQVFEVGRVNISTSGSISTDGYDSYGILAQVGGTGGAVTVQSSSDIDMTATDDTGTGIFAWNQTALGLIDVLNGGTITGSGAAMRGIGLSTAGATSNGDYTVFLDNSGAITLDSPVAYGITVDVTTGDDLVAEIENSGDIDLSASTDDQSIGIFVTAAEIDANETRDGNSRVTLTNSGEIEMGAGSAIVALADQIDFTDNVGVLLTGGDQSDVVRLGSAGDPAQISAGFNQTVIGSLGDESNGIVIEPLADGSQLSMVLDTIVLTTTGTDSNGILVEQLGEGTSAAFTIQDSTIAASGQSSDAISIAAIGQDSALSFVADNSTFAGTDSGNGHAVLIGGVAGPNSVLNVELSNTAMSTAGDTGTVFEIANFIQTGSTATFNVEDGSIVSRGDDSRGIAIGTTPPAALVDQSSQSVSIFDSSISTSGDRSTGVFVDSQMDGVSESDLLIVLSGVEIATEGESAHGIDIIGAQNVTIGDRAGAPGGVIADVVIGATADITAEGVNSDAIRITNQGETFIGVSDGATVSSSGGNAIGVSGMGTVTLDTEATGTIIGDIVLSGGDDVFENSGTFTGNIDMGGGANAIFVRTGGVFNSLDQILLGMGNAITVEGDLSPGGVGPIQTTAIGSDLVLADGSRLLIDIDGMASDPGAAGFFQSDRITVDGDITIGDATLAISSLTPEGDFDRSAQFLILDAAGTLSGEFTTIAADLPFLDLSVTYEGNNVILNAGRSGPVVPFASLGLTPNQRAVGTSFDALELGATGDLDDVIDELIFSSTDQALTAFDSLSGEIYASLLAQAGNDGMRRSREALSRARSNAAEGWGIWGGVAFSAGSIDGDGNAAGVEQDDVGFDLGVDYVGPANAWAAGFATGWRDGDLEVAERASTSDYEAWYLTGHARYGSGNAGATISGSLYYGETDAEVTRSLTINAFTRTALGNADIETFALSGEARYGFDLGGNWAIGPVVSIMYADSSLALADETGAGSVSLTSADATDEQSRYGVGLFANLQADRVGFDLSGQYVDGSSIAVGARLAFADGGAAPFTVLAPVADQSGVLLSSSGHLELGGGWRIGAQTEAMFGSDVEDVTGSVVIGWRF